MLRNNTLNQIYLNLFIFNYKLIYTIKKIKKVN